MRAGPEMAPPRMYRLGQASLINWLSSLLRKTVRRHLLEGKLRPPPSPRPDGRAPALRLFLLSSCRGRSFLHHHVMGVMRVMTDMVASVMTFHGFVATRTTMFHLFLGGALPVLTRLGVRHHLRANRRLGRFRPR